MEIILFLVLSVLAAMGFNFVNDRLKTNASFISAQGRFSGKMLYAFNTVATGLVIFVTIVIAAQLMKFAGERAQIPQ